MKAPENTAVIEMRDASVSALRNAGFVVLEDVNWSAAAGDFWVVAGQQYSGKSDFLMLAAGLMTPVKGDCKLFGMETRAMDETKLAERLRVGFVFEGGQLFNHLTLRENVVLPLQYHRNPAPETAMREVDTLLELLELTPLADITPPNISDNWRQRAALARALALKPEVLLLDNPFSRLGARHSQWWLRFLDQLWHGHDWCDRRPMTVIVTADDLRPWRQGNRKFALLRDKKSSAIGSWNDVESSNDPVLKELLAVPMELASSP